MFNPLHLITRAELSWFSAGREDARYLTRWRDVPLAYRHGQDVTRWARHHYEQQIGSDDDGARFACLADALLRYHFYPRDVMRHTSDFGLEGRQMRVGDRLVQRIPVITLFGLPGVDVMTMNEITDVRMGERCAGFSYITTQMHSEEGEWSVDLEWRADGALWLTMDAVSRPSPREPRLIHPLMRFMQRRSHRRGIEAFRALS
jgi:uncharacterized protein (UPF0548 family)